MSDMPIVTTPLRSYDFIACGAGTSGSVVAGRVAENPAVSVCREIGSSAPLRPFAKREVMPGNLEGAELERFVRDAASSYWHQTCTAKMGRDAMSVVDGQLNVYGLRGLRVADGSIMPRATTGNTMAPCVVIGERAADIIRKEHEL
jgi:choline dehydrogenase